MRGSLTGPESNDCLIHVHRDTRVDLTSKPRLQAAGELKRLTDMLTLPYPEPRSRRQMGRRPNTWYEHWKHMLAERTYTKDNPVNPSSAPTSTGMISPIRYPDATD